MDISNQRERVIARERKLLRGSIAMGNTGFDENKHAASSIIHNLTYIDNSKIPDG